MPEPFPTQTLVVYSDYLCPFCYLGKRSMESYLEGAASVPDIEWRPYDIQGEKRGPNGNLREGVDDGKDEAYFERARKNVERLKERYDVEMCLDIPEDVDSWRAQKLALFAQENLEPDRFLELHDALFEALWRDGRDIGDRGVLVDLGSGVGLEADRVREVLGDADLDRRLEARFEEARDRGIFAIPTFVYEGYALRGAVDPDQFARFLDG